MPEETIKSETIWTGRIFSLERHDIDLGGGRASIRDIIRHPGAVGVVARRRDGRFLFVKQYRKAVEEYTLEIVAGTLELGEDPDLCAHRELQEESGYAAVSMEPLGLIYPSPGIISERIHLYVAVTEGEATGLDLDDDEEVEVFELRKDEVLEAIRSGQIRDAKTLSAWQLYSMWESGDV